MLWREQGSNLPREANALTISPPCRLLLLKQRGNIVFGTQHTLCILAILSAIYHTRNNTLSLTLTHYVCLSYNLSAVPIIRKANLRRLRHKATTLVALSFRCLLARLFYLRTIFLLLCIPIPFAYRLYSRIVCCSKLREQ